MQYTIERVSYLKLLGVTFQDNPTNWDKHFDNLMERAVKRKDYSIIIIIIIIITIIVGFVREV